MFHGDFFCTGMLGKGDILSKLYNEIIIVNKIIIISPEWHMLKKSLWFSSFSFVELWDAGSIILKWQTC